jgi:hypothetical protein
MGHILENIVEWKYIDKRNIEEWTKNIYISTNGTSWATCVASGGNPIFAAEGANV